MICQDAAIWTMYRHQGSKPKHRQMYKLYGNAPARPLGVRDKLLRVMKLTTLLLLLGLLQVSARSSAQKITLDENNARLIDVFDKINAQTGFDFLFTSAMLKRAAPVTIRVTNEDLPVVLHRIFSDQQLDFVIRDKSVVLSLKTQRVTETAPVIPPATISGRVTDTTGAPLIGATVAVNSRKRAITNEKGEFTVPAAPGDKLFISYVGYKLYETTIPSYSTFLNVVMQPNASRLDEVVVNTGYQDIPRERATGSFSKISNELFVRSPTTDVLTRLQGLVSGVLFPGGTETQLNVRDNILIRGYSTIMSSKQPLVVIDNFPYEGDINSINPADIESVSILKDAAAASIWGVRAGNGVIVLTSKKGRNNQAPRVSFSSNVLVKQKQDLYSNATLSSADYIDIQQFLFSKGYYDGSISSTSYPALTPAVELFLKKRNGQITAADSAAQADQLKKYDIRNDLLKYYLRTMVNQQYNVNVTGGNANQQYYLSAGYDYNLNSTVKNDYKRITLDASNTYTFANKKLELTTGIWLAKMQSRQPSGTAYNPVTLFYPYARLADDAGNPLAISRRRQSYIDTAGGGKLLNWNYVPLNELSYADNKTAQLSYRINTGLRYKITGGLDADLKYLYEYGQTDVTNLYSQQTYYTRDLINSFYQPNATNKTPVPPGTIMDKRTSAYNAHSFRAQLNYAAVWKDIHRLSAIGGFEIRGIRTTGNTFRYYGYNENNGQFTPVDLSNTYSGFINGASLTIPGYQNISNLEDRYVSGYLNAAYTLLERYTISASGRRDGSNLFGTTTNNQWSPLWSAGLSWQIDHEPFYHIDWLPQLRWRTTYGYQGNVNKSIAALLTIQYVGLNSYRSAYSRVSNPPNPELRWEKVSQLNMGIDFATKNNRLSGSLEYFHKRGMDLIGSEILPSSSGFSIYNANTADIRSNGFDITLNSRNTTGRFTWLTTLNASYVQDIVTNYKATVGSVNYYISGTTNPVEGKPISAMYSYRWAGLNPATGDPQGYLDGHVSSNYSGIAAITDLSQMLYSGQYTPPYFGNIMNSFTWNGWDLSVNIVGKFGYVYRRGSINYTNVFSGHDAGNVDYTSRWQKAGDELRTNVPSMIYSTDPNRDAFYNLSEVLIEKGDHIRLQDMRFGYELMRGKHARPFARSVKIFVYGSNLGILWRANKSGIDPDYPRQSSFLSGKPGKTLGGGMKVDF